MSVGGGEMKLEMFFCRKKIILFDETKSGKGSGENLTN